jgi:hypothetical protein
VGATGKGARGVAPRRDGFFVRLWEMPDVAETFGKSQTISNNLRSIINEA